MLTTIAAVKSEMGITNGADDGWFADAIACASDTISTYCNQRFGADTGHILPGDPGRTLPYDIERACITLVKAYYFSRQRDPLVKSENIQDAVQSSYWIGALPPEVEGILSLHRQPAIG